MGKKPVAKTNVIIVCWNALDYTKLTLESLIKTLNHQYYLTIIDNGSTDGTIEFLRSLAKPEHCVELNIICNGKNLGYGGAINQGFEFSKKLEIKYSCICNNDLYFSTDWLKKMENTLEVDSNIAILGAMRPSLDVFDFRSGKSLKDKVDSMSDSYTPEEELRELTGELSFDVFSEKTVLRNGNNIKYLNCPPETAVTCCALVRNEAIYKLGHLADPQFEIYGSEDIDLSWSLQQLGYKVAILNKVYVHHFRHKSIKSSNLDRNKYLIENNQKFSKKWTNEINFFLKAEELKGVNMDEKFHSEDDYQYFFLRRINEKTGFYEDYCKNRDYLIVNEVNIDNPIGNLYRKNHVLILVQDKEGKYILGQKKNFYAEGISRLLGGGLNNNEDPLLAAQREINEETGLEVNEKDFFPIGQIITKANTVEGVMYMKVYLFGLILKESVLIAASDDISGIEVYSEEELKIMINKMSNLTGEYRNEKFYFLHADWGKIYGFIHDVALNNFKKAIK